MKKVLLIGFLFTVLPFQPAKAQSVFDGTWRADLNKAQPPTKPHVYMLKDGIYECKTCVPPMKIKADGQDQPVTGDPYTDMASIKVVDDRSVEETDKKDGKTVYTSKTVVAADGKSAAFEFSDSSASNAGPVTGQAEWMRVAKGPVGSHAVSGSWRTKKLENFSDNGMTVTFKSDGDMLTMSSPTGQTYTAKLDGTDAPFKGDPGVTSVSVKRAGKNTIEEIDKRDGKVIFIDRMTISEDGKTMNFTVNDKLHGTTAKYVAIKQ